jgi:hypothetical protein
MAIMVHGGVTTAGPMGMGMIGVSDARHVIRPFIRRGVTPGRPVHPPPSCAPPAANPSETPAM